MLALKRKIFELVRGYKSKTLRSWRMVDLGESVGVYCFFDPRKEKIYIYPLTYPDSPNIMKGMVSVSALVEGRGVAPHQVNLFQEGIENAIS